ncbi:MAG TPA: prepilin-type N-terminal cleavage/methylation domain-containing protein [Burkholderiales bacterium]|nr:prepilin-type N-terminal cleavage/methylation domain-containing protein [Burkholderiales bacterium]
MTTILYIAKLRPNVGPGPWSKAENLGKTRGWAWYLLAEYDTKTTLSGEGMAKMVRKHSGFTLIEIAIVLVIIGLLLGGVLKGQELITSARVRNLISEQDGIKAAFFGFQDRFRSFPGDYTLASTNINCTPACSNGNGNGRIEATGATIAENIAVWEHLSRSGFINGTYTYAATASDSTSPKNPYAVYVNVVFDAAYGDPAVVTTPQRHNIKTGGQVPVEIIAEVDRKVDDGLPYSGAFQFSNYQGNAAAAPTVSCVNTATTPTSWAVTSGVTNCGGASLL